MDAVGDEMKGKKDGSAESKAAATTDSTRISSPDDSSGITYRIERRLKIKAAEAARAARAARKKQKLDEAMTPRRRLMTTEVRHNKARLNRESNINMVQQKRILRLIKRQEKLEALHTQRIIVNEKVKLERKEQRRLKWIQDSKRNAYLWEMNNYMSRGRSKPKSKYRPFLKKFEEQESQIRKSLRESTDITYADLYIDEPTVNSK